LRSLSPNPQGDATKTAAQTQWIPLHEWFSQVLDDELGARPDDMPIYYRREIHHRISRKMNVGTSSAYELKDGTSRHNLLVQKMQQDGSGDKKANCEIKREGIVADFKLPYFGRVVDESVAATIPRRLLLPLFIESEQFVGPIFYLAGDKNCNPFRSDCCWALLIGALPKEKDKEKESDSSKIIIEEEEIQKIKVNE